MPKRSTSQSSLRPSQLNKLHLAIARKDLTKLRSRLAQPKKAKAELVEFDHMEQTPLTAALRLNLVDFVRDLLEFYKQTKYVQLSISLCRLHCLLHVFLPFYFLFPIVFLILIFYYSLFITYMYLFMSSNSLDNIANAITPINHLVNILIVYLTVSFHHC